MTQNRSGLFGGGQTQSTSQPTQLMRYAVALLSVALALGINLLFRSYLEPTPTPLFFAAVMVSAWYGGLGPGLLATVLSTVAINYFYIAPLYSLNINNVGYLTRLSVFVMAALLISSLNQAQRLARRRAEANLQAWHDSEARFSHLAESGIIGTMLADLNGFVLEANDAFLNMVGYSRDDLRSGQIRWQEMTPPEYRDVSEQSQAELRTRGVCTPFEKEYIRKDGSRAPVLLGSAMLSESTVIGFVLDIADRKQAEAALRQSEARFQVLVSNLPGMVYRYVHGCDGAAAFTYVSAGSRELAELDPEMILHDAEAFLRLIHPDDRAGFQHSVAIAIENSAVWQWEGRLTTPSGRLKWVQGRSRPQQTEYGEAWDGLFIDITDRKQAEAAHRQSEERLRVALKSSPITVFNQDQDLRYTWIYNPAFDYPVSDVIGKQDPDFFSKDDAAILTRIKRHVLETGSGRREEVKLTMLNQDFYYDLTVEPLQDVNGKTTGITCASVDITHRKQTELALRQSETTLNALIASSPIGIALFDRELRYVHANEALAAINGIPLSEHLGQRLHAVLPDWAPLLTPVLQRVMENNEPLLDQEVSGVTSPSNLVRHALVNYFPVCLGDGQVLGVGVTSMDVTDRKQAEAVRLRLAEEREQLLAREKIARQEAETANRIKDEFLAVLSHELRSPLNPILGWSKLLQTRKLSEQKTQQALATIERNAKLQTQLIEDLLDVSRILRGKLVLNIAPVSLSHTIEAALETVKLAIETKGIRVQKSFNQDIDVVMGDTARLQQVIWNLLSNAVKFTPPQGAIEIRLEPSHNCVQIQVRDTGKGINPDFLPHVFDYFRQEDGTTTRQFGGLGLGLAIVRHITELHGGTVRAESAGEGLGSTFTVQLPLLRGHDDEGQGLGGEWSANPATPHPLAGVRVLAIDDDGDVRELVEFMLQQAGAEVRVMAAATEALQQLPAFAPDILISDVGMPDMDGYMLMRQIRALAPAHRAIPAIALTAYAAEIDQQEAIAAGFQLHLAKPIEPEILISAIVNLLSKTSTSDPEPMA
ncbi:hybrid sensor histidine kinase/response regulator [Nodosilinea sp. AN01ver1]|uniref:hybrid sensor histidine kinase/response regulator n=1 Tax=Nodosilinea sp. AN01ver1 TaxID=3423362 RepID=UPI003D31CC37